MAKNQKSAASLSRQVQDGRMRKRYRAVVCGKPVDIVGNYVDYLLRDGKTNTSRVVDKSVPGSRCAKLEYRVLKTADLENEAMGGETETVSLVEITLFTGRHHQIRTQFAFHGTPLWGDGKYNPCRGGGQEAHIRQPERGERAGGAHRRKTAGRESLALASVYLSFEHPSSGKRMEFFMEPKGGIFEKLSGEKG